MPLTMWSAEVFRMMRAAVYIHELEESLKTLAGGDVVLGWEHKAHREEDPDVETTHAWTIRIGFYLVSLASIGFGEYLLWSGNADTRSSVKIGLTAIAAVAALVSLAVLVTMAWKRHVLCTPYREAEW
jgi:hypothetical protein